MGKFNTDNPASFAAMVDATANQFLQGKKATTRRPFQDAIGKLITAKEAGDSLRVDEKQVRRAIQSRSDREIRDFVKFLQSRARDISRGSPRSAPQ